MAEAAGTDGDPSILLVEDDPELAATLERYLTARGRHVTVAESGEQAAVFLHAGMRPGLIILDINLPGETGWDLVRDDAFAAAGSPPVVVATATDVSPGRLREIGAAGYLPKPFPLATLLATIDRFLPGTARP
jgi:DNA-binding response OmpR family regulator